MKRNTTKLPGKLDLGGFGAQFGKGLGRSGTFLGRSRAPLGRFGGIQQISFFKYGSKMGSERLFGSIFGRFWEGLGSIWRRICGDLESFGQVGGRFGGFGPVAVAPLPLHPVGPLLRVALAPLP